MEEFRNIARVLLEEGQGGIRSIQLAKNTVVSHLYPLEGNEKAKGLRLLELPDQRAPALRALETKRTVVAGPVKLVQGGVAFISRTPIYLTPLGESPGSGPYWGLATILIDTETLLKGAGLFDTSEGPQYALRGKDGLGAQGEVFFGNPAIFETNPVVLDVYLPNGSWQLAAIPIGGWEAFPPRLWIFRIGGGLLALMAGAVVFFVTLYRRQRAAEVLGKSEQSLAEAQRVAHLGSYNWNIVTNQITASEEACRIFSVVPQDSKAFFELVHPDDRKAVREAVDRARNDRGYELNMEHRIVRTDATERIVHERAVVVLSKQGRPIRMLGTVQDITERKRAEEALRESEARFRSMANTAPVMIWMSGPDKLCTFFNKGWFEFTGRTLEQELGNGWADGVHSDDFDRCLEIYAKAFDARQEFTMEYRLRKFDGEYCWVLDNGVPRFAPDGTFLGYIGSCIEIRERKRGEEALDQQRAFLRQVIDINPNFMFAKDREGRFTLVNQAVADAYGTTVEDVIGKTDAAFNPNREEVEFFHRMDLEVIDTLQERFIAEERITDAQGKVRWLQTVKRPIVEKDGSVNQVLGASTDITKRKETDSELRHQREELAHVTRISTMGELAASLAHELNQPLTAILSNAQAAQRFLTAKPADLEEIKDILKDIVEDNSRASEVIRRMRALVKKEDIAFESLDLGSVLRDIVQLVHSDAILRNVRISFESNSELPPVRGDKVQLHQVLLNLLLNAFDAMKDSPVNERKVVVRVETNGAGVVEVSVRDHGAGLTSAKLDKIFEPFYTTKRDGLGMGLSISRSIIDAHGGRLWAENNPDSGATFYFTVPVEGAEGKKGMM